MWDGHGDVSWDWEGPLSCPDNVTAALGLCEVHSNMYCAKETHLGDMSAVLDSLAAVWLASKGLGDMSEQTYTTSTHLSGQTCRVRV